MTFDLFVNLGRSVCNPQVTCGAHPSLGLIRRSQEPVTALATQAWLLTSSYSKLGCRLGCPWSASQDGMCHAGVHWAYGWHRCSTCPAGIRLQGPVPPLPGPCAPGLRSLLLHVPHVVCTWMTQPGGLDLACRLGVEHPWSDEPASGLLSVPESIPGSVQVGVRLQVVGERDGEVFGEGAKRMHIVLLSWPSEKCRSLCLHYCTSSLPF